MSSKESQAILKRFIDLKFSVWFTLGSEKWHLELFWRRLLVTKWRAVLFSINFKNRKNPANPNYHIVSTSWTSRLWDFYIMFLLGAGLLMFVTIFMIFSFSRWEILTDFSLLMHVQFMINLQNRLVRTGSRHMIVWFSWIFFDLWSLLKI